MTGQTDQLKTSNGSGPRAVERHFGDIAPTYSSFYSETPLNAAHVKARGAADRMWRDVEEELDKLNMTDREAGGDE